MRYTRIMVKMSGGALAGETSWGFGPDAVNHIADEVLALHHAGVEVGVVVLFDFDLPGAMARLSRGEDVGTLIGRDGDVLV